MKIAPPLTLSEKVLSFSLAPCDWPGYLCANDRPAYLAALLIGVTVSTGHPLGVAASIGIPALALRRHDRRRATCLAAIYYLAALSPLLGTADTFFRSEAWIDHLGLVDLMLPIWLFASLVLALPYGVLCTSGPLQLQNLWRGPLAVVLTAVPPLGIVGAASPLAAGGFLFPGLEWAGVWLTLFVIALFTAFPVETLLSTALVVASIHAFDTGPASSPSGWLAIDTQFGHVADPSLQPLAAFTSAQRLQQLAVSSPGAVMVFPEAVIPDWSLGTEDWWHETLASLQASGKTVLVGATVRLGHLGRFDFSADLAALEGAPSVKASIAPARRSRPPADAPYRNAVLIRGATSGEFVQRIPIPIAMWKPFSQSGVPLNLDGPRTITVAGKKTAILICYEQLIPWPILTAMLDRPSVVVAVANHFWVKNTSIPRCQRTYATAWARLFGIPILFASNT